MKVICDNCGAMYKIPDEKLVKPVNKATCRQCGHRMLIPRPRRGADPDERTLVTAVPPTPAPPPPRDDDEGPPTTPIVEHEEKTLPTGGTSADETRWVRNDVGHRDGPRPVDDPTTTRGAGAATERVPAHGGPPPAPQPSSQTASAPPPPVEPQRPRAAAYQAPIDEALEDDHDDEPPPPRSPKGRGGKAKAAPPAYDPRGDMTLALFGVFVALIGVFILGVIAPFDIGNSLSVGGGILLASSVVGLLLAISGGMTAFGVLITGRRGRKRAWRLASVLVGVLIAAIIAIIPASSRLAFDQRAALIESAFSTSGDLLARAEGPSAIVEETPAATAEGADGATEAGGPADAADTDAPTEADGTAEPTTAEATESGTTGDDGTAEASTAAATPSPRRTTTSTRGTSSRASTPVRRIASEPDRSSDQGTAAATPPEEELELPDDLDLDEPSTAARSAPASNLPESPPLTAIDIMVKSNAGVKRCFYEYMRAEGSLPSKVDLRFTIKPNGDATSITIKQNKYSGTELESCLIRSVRKIAFPPSQEGTTLTFPFVFE